MSGPPCVPAERLEDYLALRVRYKGREPQRPTPMGPTADAHGRGADSPAQSRQGNQGSPRTWRTARTLQIEVASTTSTRFLSSGRQPRRGDRKSTRLNSSHDQISYAV